MSTRWTLWDWPFFDPSHRDLAARIADWNESQHKPPGTADLTAECLTLARNLGDAGFLRYVIPAPGTPTDVRSICIIREALTYEHALADAILIGTRQ